MKKLGLGLALLLSASLLFTGCKKEAGETATVQSVSMITGVGSVGLAEHFAGVVSARSETKVKADQQKKILDILVSEGDEVQEGDVLFTYDMEAYELDLEKAQLELDQMKGALTAAEKEKAQLEKEKEKANADAQLSYTLEIESLATDIREKEYNIALKEREVGRLTESLEVTEVTAPIAGRVKKVNTGTQNGGMGQGYEDYGDGSSQDELITIVEAGAYRVKGYVNENNAGAITEGMPVIIRSRMDPEITWSGVITMIDWENPASGNQNEYYYGDSDEMTTSSKFPFYVELDNSEGLLLGQHVYIENDLGQDEEKTGLYLPEYFLTDIEEGKASVWAQNKNGRLEKRALTIGSYDEMMGTYEILSGLDASDFIAYPDETLKEGMACVEFDPNTFDPEDGGDIEEGGYIEEGVYEEGPMDGEMFEEDMMPVEDQLDGDVIEETVLD